GAVYLQGHLAEFARFLRRLNRVRLGPFFDFTIGAGGLISGNRVLKVLRPIFGAMPIEELPLPFGCVATDLATGEEVWLRDGSLIEALRASYAIPGLFPPVRLGGRFLFDGALVNPVPVSLARALGADLVVAVDVNAGILVPLSFGADQPEGLTPSFFARRKGLPSPFGMISRSLQLVQTRLSRIRLAEDPPALVLKPEVGRIGPLEFHRAADCMEAGARAVRQALPALREALRAPVAHSGRPH
ncbi:MAG: patatin-like phospholipase family protein, partial [Stellaceae bacterium]